MTRGLVVFLGREAELVLPDDVKAGGICRAGTGVGVAGGGTCVGDVHVEDAPACDGLGEIRGGEDGVAGGSSGGIPREGDVTNCGGSAIDTDV